MQTVFNEAVHISYLDDKNKNSIDIALALNSVTLFIHLFESKMQ